MLKFIAITWKDLRIASRRTVTLLFMFGLPLLMTGLFYLMFGNIAREGGFSLSRIQVGVANEDKQAPRLQTSRKNVPGNVNASTLSDLVVKVLQSEELQDLLAVTVYPDGVAAKAAVDNGQQQVAVIIPSGFSKNYSEPYKTSTLEFYQDPTLTLTPAIVSSILHQFMDSISGAKIAVQVAVDGVPKLDQRLVNLIVGSYLQGVSSQKGDLREDLLQVLQPGEKPKASSLLSGIIGPIMAGVMVFYAFYTGAARAQSFLEEEEEYTLQRLFTTPTPLSSILIGKMLQVFVTVLFQVAALIGISSLLFRIHWGPLVNVILLGMATVVAASSFGVFLVSLMKSTKQGGVLFGGVLTVSGMLGMISMFAGNTPNAARLSNTVALLVPQGWAVRGFQQCIAGASFSDLLPGALALIGWSLVMFLVGLLRFQRRYR